MTINLPKNSAQMLCYSLGIKPQVFIQKFHQKTLFLRSPKLRAFLLHVEDYRQKRSYFLFLLHEIHNTYINSIKQFRYHFLFLIKSYRTLRTSLIFKVGWEKAFPLYFTISVINANTWEIYFRMYAYKTLKVRFTADNGPIIFHS